MVAPAQPRVSEIRPERASSLSAFDRVLRAVRAGWKDYTTAPDASQEAQARYARRIANGDVIDIDGEIWNIVAVTKGDNGDPVIVQNGTKHYSVASLDLERVEKAARLMDLVDGPSNTSDMSEIVTTGASRASAAIPVMATLEDDEPATPVVKEGVPLTLRYGAVDVSEAVEDRARDTAEEALNAEKRDAGFFAKLLKHNIAYEVFRQYEISRSRSKILREKNLYAADNLDRDAHRRATEAVVDRFITEYDGFLHGEGKTAEKKKVFGDSPEEAAVKERLKSLVIQKVGNPQMDDEEYKTQRERILADMRALAGDAKGRGVMYADNLDKILDEVSQQAAHANGLENLEFDIEITLGLPKLGARTERDRNMLDRAIDGLQRYNAGTRFGSGILNALHNEVAVALGTAWVLGGIVGRAKAGLAAAATFGTSMVATGVYSAYKEKSRLGRERSLHERQMAMGGKTENDDLLSVKAELNRRKAKLGWWNVMERHAIDKELEELENGREVQPRRAEMEKFALSREHAKGLAESARSFLSGRELRGDVSFADAASALADIEARVRISDRERIDMLEYTNVADAEVERKNLDVARAQLKAALRAKYADDTTIDKTEFADFQMYFNSVYGLREGELYGKESAVQKQHRAFAKWSNAFALRRGVTTMVIGAAVGFAAHEVWAFGNWLVGNGNGSTTSSVIAALHAYFNNAPSGAAGAPNVETIGAGVFTTPSGTDLIPQADGSFVLEATADHRAIASGLHIDALGRLDSASEATLRSAGANIVEKDQWINTGATTSTTESTWDWLRHHAMQKIHRDRWMDNNTPMHYSDDLKRWLGADHNELKLEWGGVMGPDGVHPIGLNADGQIVMNLGHMTPDGSWHNGLTENAPVELVEGKVRVLLTMNDRAQNSVIEILPDQHGQIHIDPNSDIGKTFFRIDHSKVAPLYHTAEVGISKGFDSSGVNHFNILATHTGQGTAEGITSTDIGKSITQHVTNIDFPGREVPPIVIPPFLPIRGRQPMEPLGKERRRAVNIAEESAQTPTAPDRTEPQGPDSDLDAELEPESAAETGTYTGAESIRNVIAALALARPRDPFTRTLVLRNPVGTNAITEGAGRAQEADAIAVARNVLNIPEQASSGELRRALIEAITTYHPDHAKPDDVLFDVAVKAWQQLRGRTSPGTERPMPLQIAQRPDVSESFALTPWVAPLAMRAKEEEQYFAKRRRNGTVSQDEHALDLILQSAQQNSALNADDARMYNALLKEALGRSKVGSAIKTKKRKGLKAIIQKRLR